MMTGIRAVFLDVDNTLLDFDQCALQAMDRGFALLNRSCGEREHETFFRINRRMWAEIEQGVRTREELERDRWALIFRDLGLTEDGPAFEREFRRQLAQTGCLESGAVELVQYLYGKYPLYFATNGMVSSQMGRLRASGLLPYATDVFIFEDVGYPKPDARFFDVCLSRMPDGVHASEICLIGDSLSADIIGAVRYGLHTIWYDRANTGTPSPAEETVHTLDEIRQYL